MKLCPLKSGIPPKRSASLLHLKRREFSTPSDVSRYRVKKKITSNISQQSSGAHGRRRIRRRLRCPFCENPHFFIHFAIETFYPKITNLIFVLSPTMGLWRNRHRTTGTV